MSSKRYEEDSVYDYSHYRAYLNARLSKQGSRGARSQLALKTQTRPAFITQVLSGVTNLSPEHIPPTNEFLGHSEEESHFFFLLVLHARAGSGALEKYYQKQIQEILAKRKVYLNRIKPSEEITITQKSLYYSQWHYAAIHVLTSIPAYQTKTAICERLKLPPSTVSTALEYLVRIGAIENKNGKYLMGKKRVYLKKDSPYIAQMHTSYRNRAIHSLTAPESDDFHLSQTMSLSFEDFSELRKALIQFLKEFEPKISASKEEELFALNLDLFKFV